MFRIRDCFKFLFKEEFNDLEYYKLENTKLKRLLETCEDYPPLPNEFETLAELKSWFLKNKISAKQYIKDTYDCDDFAVETQKAALSDGYIVNLELDMDGSYNKSGVPHMLCGCKIGNMYYIIEPQNDKIIYRTRLD